MKQYILLMLLLIFSLNTFSKPLDSSKMADLVSSLIVDRMIQEPGISGIEVTGCDPKTGKKINTNYDFVHCVQLYGDSDKAIKNLLSIYPIGTRIKGVHIIIGRLERGSLE